MFFFFLLLFSLKNFYFEEKKDFFPPQKEKALFVLNFNGDSRYLENFKIKTLSYLGNGNYLVQIEKKEWELLYLDKNIKALRHFKKEWKLNLSKETSCYRYLKVEANDLKTHKICLNKNEIENFLEREDVAYIENDWEINLRNDTTSWVIQSNEQNYYPFYEEGLEGEGEIIGHIDTQIYLNSCYFYDGENEIGPNHRKVVGYRAPTLDGREAHGTHTAGTAAGYAEGEKSNGIARKAKLSYSYINYIEGIGGEDSNLYDYLELAHIDGARIHTNSWGDDSTNEYTLLSYDADKFSYDYQSDLIVFSITNNLYLKVPENAKNVLSVGSTHQAPLQDFKCSGGIGPTLDGRLKPDLFVPGCGIKSASAISNCDTLTLSGTSMASPAVSGAAAIVREYLKKKYEKKIEDPSGALIKAILINSGEDLKSIDGYPNFEEGWGRVLLEKTLPLSSSSFKLFIEDLKKDEGLFEGEEKIYKINVSSANIPLLITLVWTDYPAFPSSQKILVNDLDLLVISPSGKIYKGNFFENGYSITDGEHDDKNNVERIILKEPEVGTYILKVKGSKVPMPPQNFSLVVTGDLKESLNYYFPVLANLKGDKNSNWKTSLWIYNNSEEQKITFKFYLNGNLFSKEYFMGKNEIFYKENFLSDFFEIENSFGPLIIEAEKPLKTYIRIYNSSENGTCGQSYKGFIKNYGKNDLFYFNGIFLTEEKRTNFGITNFGKEEASVKLKIYDSSGNFLSEREIYISPTQNIQKSIKEIFPSVSVLNSGFIFLEILKGEGIIPYISVITNKSNDGIFIEPQILTAQKKLIPVLIGNKNPTGYPWRSEIFIFTESEENFKGNLRVLQENEWKDFEIKLNIGLFKSYYIEDFFQDFNLNEGLGYMTFEGKFLVYERIYSGIDIKNSFGQYIASYNLNDLKKFHFLPVTLPDINFRINIGFTNPFEEQVICKGTIKNKNGEKLEEKILGVEGKNFIQYPLKEFYPNLPIREPLVLVLECSKEVFSYISLVDNRTSDGSFFADF